MALCLTGRAANGVTDAIQEGISSLREAAAVASFWILRARAAATQASTWASISLSEAMRECSSASVPALWDLVGSFCQIVIGDQGGHQLLLFFVHLEAAQGPVGLEDAEFPEVAVIGALGLAMVAMEAVEGFGGGFVEEGVEAVDHEVGFEALEAVHVPGGAQELVEGEHFDGSFGAEFLLKLGLELIEFIAFVFADDKVLGGESVFEGVPGGSGFAFGGARAAGELGIGGVSSDFCWRHELVLSVVSRDGFTWC